MVTLLLSGALRWGGHVLCLAGLAAALVWSVADRAEASQPSDRIVTQILIAQQEGQEDGDPAAGATRLLALRDGMPAPPGRNRQQAVDHAMLTLYAAGLTAGAGDAPAALDLYEEATDGFAGLGPGWTAAQAVAMEGAAALVATLGDNEAAYGRLLQARALRDRVALPPDARAVAALERAGRLAMAMNDTPAMLEELRATLDTASAISPHDTLLQARAFGHGAALATATGVYPVTEDLAGMAASSANGLLYRLETGTMPDGQEHGFLCQALGPLHRDLIGTLIDIGALAEAARLLQQQLPRLQAACDEDLPPWHATFVNTLGARLHLRVGDPFSAHLRLRAAAAGAGTGDADDDALTAGIVRARQAEARLALGFPGEAAEALAQVPEGLGMSVTTTHEHERLMVLARLHEAQGRPEAALAALARAEDLQRQARPLHWYPRMAIAYRRALLLLETGAPEAAEAVRAAFEAELAGFIDEVQAGGQALGAAGVGDMQALMTELFGAGFARQQEARRRAGAFEHVGFRELDRLRMLYALAQAARHGDAQAARAAFEAVPERGLPADTAFAGLAQRAYLAACFKGYGPGLRCDMAAASAMEHPTAVPHACVGGCPWVMGEAADLVVSAGMRRRGPLVDGFAEPVLAALIAEADAARAELLPPDGLAATDPELAAVRRGTALAMGRFVGAGAAFELAQRRLEGEAAEAVAQLGARLAAGDGPLAGLMRERDALTDRLDALFRDGAAAPGDIDSLTAALNANRRALAALRPDHAELFDVAPMQPEEIAALLPEGAAFVLISSTEAATYAFAVRGTDLDWRRAPIGAAALEAQVATLRAALDPEAPDRAATAVPGPLTVGGRRFDRDLAHALYRDLLAPLEPLLEGAELYVVADGPLGALPLAVLVRSPPEGDDGDAAALRATDWLLHHHPVTMLAAPTGLRLARLQRARPTAPRPFIGFGDPVFAPPGAPGAAFAGLARLPGTRTEIERLATVLGGATAAVHLGRDATKAAVMSAPLHEARVIGFATHGLLAGQMDGLGEPGLVFSAPPGAEADPAASYLTASEAATLELNADWVLLSACSTAGPDGRPDARGLSGLARAFLFAGARSVLVSHWPVRDDAAMLLTTQALSWHVANPAASRARALQHAMQQVIAHPQGADLAHPSAWAPFVLLGDG